MLKPEETNKVATLCAPTKMVRSSIHVTRWFANRGWPASEFLTILKSWFYNRCWNNSPTCSQLMKKPMLPKGPENIKYCVEMIAINIGIVIWFRCQKWWRQVNILEAIRRKQFKQEWKPKSHYEWSSCLSGWVLRLGMTISDWKHNRGKPLKQSKMSNQRFMKCQEMPAIMGHTTDDCVLTMERQVCSALY